MIVIQPREPMSALSHAVGFVLALAVTRSLWRQSIRQRDRLAMEAIEPGDIRLIFERGKRAGMLIFGLSLMFCYGASAVYHAATVSGEPLNRLRRLDHVGIYLLIAGTYTPAAWSLLKGTWRSRTLASVWTVAFVCGLRVWLGGVFPGWASTLIYLSMGWGVVFCYRELARDLGHRTLLPLPLGGAFYSVGAVMNLAGWPVLAPGVLGAHDLFHLFVIAGSTCHVVFMMRTVIPAEPPVGWAGPRFIPAPHFDIRLAGAGQVPQAEGQGTHAG